MRMKLGQTTSGKVYIALSLLLLALGGYAFARKQAEPPIYTTGSDVPDPNVQGNIDQALQQAQQLLAALQAVNYDVMQVDSNLLYLPDRRYAENEVLREGAATSFYFTDDTIPELSEIAFYSDIYARQNTSYYTGDVARSAPSGYYIVAWKNGTVEKVPVADIRLLTRADGVTQVDCFPGMTGYDPNLPVWGQ